MTTNNFKKAIENEVKNYLYASAITSLMHIENFCATGKRCGNTTVAIIAVQEDHFAVKRWRVYYNYSISMKNEIAYLNFDNYSDACKEFAKFA